MNWVLKRPCHKIHVADAGKKPQTEMALDFICRNAPREVLPTRDGWMTISEWLARPRGKRLAAVGEYCRIIIKYYVVSGSCPVRLSYLYKCKGNWVRNLLKRQRETYLKFPVRTEPTLELPPKSLSLWEELAGKTPKLRLITNTDNFVRSGTQSVAQFESNLTEWFFSMC